MTTGQTQRCFVAWMPTPAERAVLASLQDGVRAACADPGHRWIAPDQLHVTLRFLGDASPAQREHAARNLAALAAETRCLLATVAGLQYWPSGRSPRVLVLDLDSVGALEALGAGVETRMRAAGFAPERRSFRAHLTLARIRSTRTCHPPSTAIEPLALAVDHVALVRSTLLPSGSVYDELARWPLRQFGPPQVDRSGYQ